MGKSLRELKERLMALGGRTIEPNHRDFQDLKTLITDMMSVRNNPPPSSGSGYYSGTVCSTHSDVGSYALSESDIDDLVISGCSCDSVNDRTPYCSSRTTCLCHSRTSSSCSCHSRTACTCDGRTTYSCTCYDRTACTCNSETTCTCQNRTSSVACTSRYSATNKSCEGQHITQSSHTSFCSGHSYDGSLHIVMRSCTCNTRTTYIQYTRDTWPLCTCVYRTAAVTCDALSTDAVCSSRTACQSYSYEGADCPNRTSCTSYVYEGSNCSSRTACSCNSRCACNVENRF